ncbi:DUF4097 family beta strand repeat-containing protein [Pyrococcus kukulkanii]|uniref:DUF4097 family beta strand repeat-containing protein n=1 Tax=Pyrococcus kukulkanii TaxID=1609559 RepID=UPI0035631B74
MIFEDVKEVIVSSVSGKITVEEHKEDFAEVNYTIEGECDVEIKQEGEKLIIKEKPKRKKILGIINKDLKGKANITVRVPESVSVTASTVNGTVLIEGAKAKKITSVNGSIVLKEARVSEVSTVNGGVSGSIALAEDLKVSAVNGSIGLDIEDMEGDGIVSTVNGSVRIRMSDLCDVTVIATAVNGRIHVDDFEDGEFKLKISTVNGSVVVERF